MKKFFALFLTLVLLVSAVPAAFAENATANTTTLTTTVPSATYVLNIPADQEIPFGQTSTDIGSITITNSKNFAIGKNVNLGVTHDSFTAENVSTQIPYSIEGQGTAGGKKYYTSIYSNAPLVFKGQADGTVAEKVKFEYNPLVAGAETTMDSIYVKISSDKWGKALEGDYKSTITFTAEVVAG